MSYTLQRMSRAAPLLCLVLLAGPVHAQPARQVEIEVGKTAKVNVGLSRGLNCDDLAVVDAKLQPTKDKKEVLLVLKGKAAGETYCRAGTSLGSTVLIHITVVDPPL